MRLFPVALLALLASAACGGGAPDDIVRICEAATECGAIGGTDTDRCISDLDGATPDSASRAAAECADCMDTKTCGDVKAGMCAATCKPLFDTINSVPGKVSGGCTSTTNSNFAIKSSQGNLLLQFDCSPDVQIIPGPYFDTIGTTKPCGKFTSSDMAQNCDQATGNITIQERDGRRWAVGSCSCSGKALNFELPFRISF
jgi:hypothetical protein